jgi:hypothetical protein
MGRVVDRAFLGAPRMDRVYSKRANQLEMANRPGGETGSAIAKNRQLWGGRLRFKTKGFTTIAACFVRACPALRGGPPWENAAQLIDYLSDPVTLNQSSRTAFDCYSTERGPSSRSEARRTSQVC